MRPRYETEKDLKEEARILGIVEKRFGDRFIKQRVEDRLDFVSWKVDKVMEIKRRYMKWFQFETYLISQNKFDLGRRFENELWIPFMIVVGYDDKLRYYVYNKKDDPYIEIKKGGRVDRKDPKDIEMCAFIPIRLMTDWEWPEDWNG